MVSSTSTSRTSHRLAQPKPVAVSTGSKGRPVRVNRQEVIAIRESWLVEDRWWSDTPLRRRYWEVVTEQGRNLVIFRDLLSGRWYAQSG